MQAMGRHFQSSKYECWKSLHWPQCQAPQENGKYETNGVVAVTSSVNKQYALNAAGLSISVAGGVSANNVFNATGFGSDINLLSTGSITGTGTSTIALTAADAITGSNTGTLGKLPPSPLINLAVTAGDIGPSRPEIRTNATNLFCNSWWKHLYR